MSLRLKVGPVTTTGFADKVVVCLCVSIKL
jgi:hypothetical protein